MEDNKQQELWEQIQQFYLDKFGIEAASVELMADIDILRLCAAGSSNKTIARFLDLPEDDEAYQPVADTLDRYLGFRGWQEDLLFSPLQFYKSLDNPDKEKFTNAMVLRFGNSDNLDIVHMYAASALVDSLERTLDENWV